VNLSEPFIRRPVGTTLLALGLLLLGIVAYRHLPVASLPAVDLPTIRISAARPGADPATMAATIAAPLERRLGAIAGVTEITSSSSLGSSHITVQFDLSRSVDGAARDVQAALNAAASDLPGDLPTLPFFRKINPAAAPVLILALTSDTLTPTAVFDVADSVIGQRIAQVPGVGEVSVSGADQPAIRISVDPGRLAALGLSLEEVRQLVAATNALGPAGAIDGPGGFHAIAVNDQLRRAQAIGDLVLKADAQGAVRLSSIASVRDGARNSRSEATFNGRPAVLLVITKQAEANVIETTDDIKALLPGLKRWTPAGLDIAILADRTETIRASVADMQMTLALTALLVMGVVMIFLHRLLPVLAAGATVPLSLAGTFALMWLAGFSIDNLSLLALAVAVGLVVDDAIVVIENIDRRRAAGEDPFTAAVRGARQIGFTVLAISLSLLAALIPLFFIGGTLGLFFREFSMTLAFAIVVSTVLALTLTPMLCARMGQPTRPPGRVARAVEGGMARLVALYGRSLEPVLRRRRLALLGLFATIGATIALFVVTPKGFIPRDETGLLFGFSEASTDISFAAMTLLQRQVSALIADDPAVAGVGSTIGGSSINQGRLYVTLKPAGERPAISAVVDRLRQRLAGIAGIQVYLVPVQDLRVGGRSARSEYQLTLWGPDYEALMQSWPRLLDALKSVPGLVDVNSDRQPSGLEATLKIDRVAAARLGVGMADIGAALNNAFAQRQISTYYGPRNQYRVVLEAKAEAKTDPTDITAIHVPGANGTQVPLSAIASVERALAPVSVQHQGAFPAITLSYSLAPDTTLAQASERIADAVAKLHLPDSVRVEAAGDAKAFIQSSGNQGVLIIAALLAVYIVLGVLYESLTQPLTILSTLPSAGLGALLALNITGAELTLIAMIGLVLLIGLVKKNGIMLVDFALDCERRQGMAPTDAIREACLKRFRPILMTTLAALLGTLPLILASGPGAELRRPLGITIAGGLIVSQMLTLYTTPAVYLAFDALSRRFRRKTPPAQAATAERKAPLTT
jgi:multidrug efflux pump